MDIRRITTQEELSAYLASVTDDESLSTGGVVSSGVTDYANLFSWLAQNIVPITNDVILPPASVEPSSMLSEEQQAKRRVLATALVIPAIERDVYTEGKWQANSEGTNYKSTWISKDITPNYYTTPVFDPIFNILSEPFSIPPIPEYFQCNNPVNLVTFTEAVVGAELYMPAYTNGLNFLPTSTTLAIDYNSSYAMLMLNTYMAAFYKSVELRFYLTDFEGNRLPPVIPNAYLAVLGLGPCIDDVSFEYLYASVLPGWSIDEDTQELVYTKTLRPTSYNEEIHADGSISIIEYQQGDYVPGVYIWISDRLILATPELLLSSWLVSTDITSELETRIYHDITYYTYGGDMLPRFYFKNLNMWDVINITSVKLIDPL